MQYTHFDVYITFVLTLKEQFIQTKILVRLYNKVGFVNISSCFSYDLTISNASTAFIFPLVDFSIYYHIFSIRCCNCYHLLMLQEVTFTFELKTNKCKKTQNLSHIAMREPRSQVNYLHSEPLREEVATTEVHIFRASCDSWRCVKSLFQFVCEKSWPQRGD